MEPLPLTVMYHLSRRFTQMGLSLSQKPTIIATLTTPSVSYQGAIIRLALPIQRNDNMRILVFLPQMLYDIWDKASSHLNLKSEHKC